MKKSIFIISCMVSIHLFAQTGAADLREGNNQYRLQQFDKAESYYQKALKENGTDEKAKFNLANAQHKQGKDEDAVKVFTEIALSGKDKNRVAAAYYNKGVILSKEKKLEESIEAYKNALRQNPDDSQARENLQKALLELKKKNPPKKEQKKDQQKQQKKQQQQPKMSSKEAEQRLKLLEQKEKEVNQRLQKEKSKSGGGQAKDW